MSFWDGMELWEKMLFVLACAMVCTLVYAITRLITNNRRIRKHTKLAEARREHLEYIRNNRHIITLKGEDIPFGVKALESGIEVEGIVISRPVTPNSNRSQQTLVGSDFDGVQPRPPSVPSPQGQQMRQTGRPMVYQPSPYVAIPAPLYHGVSARSSSVSIASMPPRSSPSDWNNRRAYSDPLLQYFPPPPRTSSLTSPISLSRPERAVSTSPPNGHRRTTSPTAHSPSNPSSPTGSRTPSPPDGQRMSNLASVGEYSTEESSRSYSSDSDRANQSSQPRLYTAYSTPVTTPAAGEYRDITAAAAGGGGSGDLSALHSHRLSHAAEVGQLLPRNSRMLRSMSGYGFSFVPPTPASAPASTPAFVSTAVADPMYALDVAVPLAVPATVRKCPPAPLPQDHRRTYSSPVGETSRFVENFWSSGSEPELEPEPSPPQQPPSVAHEQTDGASDPKPEVNDSKKRPNRLRKKCAGSIQRASAAFEFDLEATAPV